MSTWSPTRQRAEAEAQTRQTAALAEREDLRAFMGSPLGRRIVWRLIQASGVLQETLLNNTATVQSALVAVRDFGMHHLLSPILATCPELFLKMKAENDGSTADG